MRAAISHTITVLSLSAILPLALADEPRPAMVPGVPGCAANGHGDAKHIWESDAGDCNNAVYAMYAAGAQTYKAPSNGCNSITKQGNCEIFLCGMGNGDSTISAGAISLAALDIHAYCRLNGRVGGRTVVYTQEGDGKKGSTMVQLGEIHKDELKRRDEDEPESDFAIQLETREEEPSPVEFLGARDLDVEPELRHRRRQLGKRANPDPEDPNEVIDNASAVNEGEQHDISIFNQLMLQNEFITDIRQTMANPNPNWRNTAMASRRFHDQHRDRQVEVTIAFLGENMHDVNEFRHIARDNRLQTLISTIIGQWHQGGFRTLFSNHIYRRYTNSNARVNIGQIAITVEDIIEGPAPPVAILPGGSRF
ncbi:uncharacterized protein E0L32_002544 [Thyridium curvatum]|uniref:Uncharacterized protein n=1 Tax=Thyridium curvatum TaxID=1093900 RepID=A0A507BFK7_9PEZI|nr:uncharacterized protein E0L32_002544 [Thyridium curvatum]TPX18687.1 hypothetical protein E0L32_002544 [Thyridium curvatum]